MLQTACISFSWLLNVGNQKDGLFPASFSFLVAILGISLLYSFWKARKPMAPLPPGPRGSPILGGVYGPIYKLWLGNKLTVVISSPSLVKEVVRDHDIAFSEREPLIAAQIITFGSSDIAFDSYSSPSWKNKRKVLATDMLSNANLNACYDLRREQVMKMVEDVYENVGKPIDIGELAFCTLINLIGKMGRFKEISSQMVVLMGKPNISDIFPAIAWFDMQESVIELRMNTVTEKETSEQKSDFLQLLLDLHNNQDSPSSLTMNQVKGLLMDIVVGATDTTSTTTEWAMAELMQHPEIMEKVKKELTDVVGVNEIIEEFHLPNLSYLSAVIKETFRLHPPVPLLFPRFSAQSLTVGGYNIPKGSKVFLNMWFLDEPGKFDFLRNDFRYMPFGSGRRRCPGITLGEKMLSFILASLLHSFEWKLPQGEQLGLSSKFGIVMKKKNPLRLIPIPRLSDHVLYKNMQP
ncbi:hypothetical protein ES288_D03G194500v1 [Gossypium darwinii]|uniref:Cytochrome P450 n=1 Tax=Gossypium darwinii TaxID=34276 RepID=A0A5D2DAK7_GOSDA|nr:hypothetical protein ES288_D03G194500v1 [Gossypium darwinii]